MNTDLGGTLTFITTSVTNYNFAQGGKRVTKLIDGWHEGVYMNAFIVDVPIFQVKVINKVPSTETFIGVALDSSLYSPILRDNSWSYWDGGMGFDHGASYGSSGPQVTVNKTVTVVVNIPSKTIEFKINGNTTGAPRFMNLTDSQFQLLRPIVQMMYATASIEIVP